MSKGMQFRGVPAIVKAFGNMDLAKWSVKYDKGIVCKYDGSDKTEGYSKLQGFLTDLQKSGSEAIYTLNVYEDLPKGQKIKPSTEPDYSFYFSLFDAESYPSPYMRRHEADQALLDKIEMMEAKIAKYEDEDDEPEKIGGVMGMLNGIVEDPRFKEKIIDQVFGIVDKIMNPKPAAPVHSIQNNTGLGAVGKVADDAPILIDEAEHIKLQTAVDILVTVDPELGTNLLKIANTAKQDPAKYKQMISMLNSIL
jgi:hypothetical protein